jgi:hypothetical protein
MVKFVGKPSLRKLTLVVCAVVDPMLVENENAEVLKLKTGVLAVTVKVIETGLGTQGRLPVQDTTTLPWSVPGVSPVASALIVKLVGVLAEFWVTVSQLPPVCLLAAT